MRTKLMNGGRETRREMRRKKKRGKKRRGKKRNRSRTDQSRTAKMKNRKTNCRRMKKRRSNQRRTTRRKKRRSMKRKNRTNRRRKKRTKKHRRKTSKVEGSPPAEQAQPAPELRRKPILPMSLLQPVAPNGCGPSSALRTRKTSCREQRRPLLAYKSSTLNHPRLAFSFQ